MDADDLVERAFGLEAEFARIVAGWPQRIDARRARELGFKAENSFDEIIRIHIDEDRGGTFVD